MPLVTNVPDEEEQKQGTTAPQGPISPTGDNAIALSPSGAVPSAGGAGSAGKTPSTAGGGFASLDKYVAANINQAAPLAGMVTSGVQQEYGQQAAQNQAALQNIQGQVTNAPGYVAGGQDVLAAEAANPVSFSQGQGNTQRFQSLLKNAYGGPASAEGTSDYANRQNAINQAIAQGNAAVGTEAGREGLLAKGEATPTTGVTALNEAILSQSPEASAQVQSAYKPFEGLLTGLQSGAADINKQIGQEQQHAAESSKAANEQIADQISKLNQGVATNVSTAQNVAGAQNAALQAGIKSGNLSPTQLSALGMSQDQWNALTAAQKAAATAQTVKSNQGQFGATTGTTNVDLGQFLTEQNPADVISAANVATPQQYEEAKAFQNLLAGLPTNAPTLAINPAASSQAGTAPTNLGQFDYQAALNTAQAAKQDEVAAAQAYVDALQSGSDEKHAQEVAAQAGRQKFEQIAAPVANTVTLPFTAASQIPVIGAPIANAVDTVVQSVTGGTWICTAMKEVGVISEAEIEQLHNHLYRALSDKPWSFFRYWVLAGPVIWLANKVHVHWQEWKPLFYERPMMERDPIKAVDLYEEAFWSLTKHAISKIGELL